MNKKISLVLIAFSMILILTNCTSHNSDNTESVPHYSYDKMRINGYINETFSPDIALYKLLFDGVEKVEDKIFLGDIAVDEKKFENVVNALQNRLEFPYLSSIQLSYDNYATITYKNDKETSISQCNKFRSKVTNILKTVVNPQNTQLENALNIFNYFTENIRYSKDGETSDGYSALVNNTAICYGYSYAFVYLLDQINIESHITSSTDESHMWVIAKLDGKYYHIDPTNGFMYFGLSDTQMKKTYNGWYSGNMNYAKYDSPICKNEEFAFLQHTQSISYAPDISILYFSDNTDNFQIKQFSAKTQKILTCGKARGINLNYNEKQLIFQSIDKPYSTYSMSPKTFQIKIIK